MIAPPRKTSCAGVPAPIVLTNKAILSGGIISKLPALRYIGVLATGVNVVDIAAARARKIVVTNVPAYSTPSVAQLTLALLLELCHRVGHHSETVRAGRWTRSPDFTYSDFPQIELQALTLGVVGFGSIGQQVARLGAAFGMNVLTTSRRQPTQLPPDVKWAGLEQLLRESDVVSLHCPLTPETQQFINRERLAQMKPTAFLINTARGALIDEECLAAALNEGRLAGAAMDVLSVEPPPAENPLLRAKNCLITPHVGWATRTARQRLLATAAANIQSFLAGKAQNQVC